jgi:hypothetical protein
MLQFIYIVLVITSVKSLTLSIDGENQEIISGTMRTGKTEYNLINVPLCINDNITSGCLLILPYSYKRTIAPQVERGAIAVIFRGSNPTDVSLCGMSYDIKEEVPMIMVSATDNALLMEVAQNGTGTITATPHYPESCEVQAGIVIRPIIMVLSALELIVIAYIVVKYKLYKISARKYQLQLCAFLTIAFAIIAKTHFCAIDPFWTDPNINTALTTIMGYIMHGNLLCLNLVYTLFMLLLLIDYRNRETQSRDGVLFLITAVTYLVVMTFFVFSGIIFHAIDFDQVSQILLFLLVDIIVFVACTCLMVYVNIQFAQLASRLTRNRVKYQHTIVTIITMVVGEIAFIYIFMRIYLPVNALRDVIITWTLTTVCEIVGIISVTKETTRTNSTGKSSAGRKVTTGK